MDKLHVQLTILRRFNVFDLKKSAPDGASHVVGDSIFVKETAENSFARELQVDVLLEGKHLLPFLVSQRQRFGVYTTMNFWKSWLRRLLTPKSLRVSALFRVNLL